MELVYLWVEDYKNIHKQGFNFSPRFECKFYDKYDKEGKLKDDCKLDIKPKEHIENFFGDNINVTAIVGKNGSGKSSILEILEKIDAFTSELYGVYRKNFILLFKRKNNGLLKLITNIENLPKKDIYDIIYIEPMQRNATSFPESKKIIYKDKKNEVLGRKSYIHPNTFQNYFSLFTYMSEMPYPYFEKRLIEIKRGRTMSFDIKKIVEIIGNSLNDNFKLTTFMLIPEVIYIEQNNDLLQKYLNDIRPLIIPRSNNPENGLLYEDCHNEREEYSTENILEAYFFLDIIKSDLSSYLCNENFYNLKDLFFDSNILENFYNNKEYELNEEKYSLNEFNSLLKKIKYDKKLLTKNNIDLIKKYSKFLILNFEDDKGRRYNNLSHGEKTIFGQFLNIYEKSKYTNNLLIVLDEPDLSLHPEWQRKYIYELSNTFFNLNKNIHFITMSHSPFLLSDIPKQNIIFLDTDENGNCKVVNGLKEKKQTFGANIHTLLSDSFFMEDGLIGKFAQNKIQEVINFLKGKVSIIKSANEAKKIIDIIGEPFLKMQIEDLYNKKFPETLELDEQIKKLKQELGRLENAKNRN